MDADFLRKKWAFHFNTLPKFVFQNSNQEWDNFETQIVQIPISALISPFQFFQALNARATIPLPSLTLEEIAFFYIFFNARFLKFMFEEQGNLFHLRAMFGLTDEEEQVLQHLWQERTNPKCFKARIELLEHQKQQFRMKFQRELELEEALKRVGAVPRGQIFFNRVTRIYELFPFLSDQSVGCNDMGEILRNVCLVSEKIPLIVGKEHYKVFKNHSPRWPLTCPKEPWTLFLYSIWGRVDCTIDLAKNSCLISIFSENVDLEQVRRVFCGGVKKAVDGSRLSLTRQEWYASVAFPDQMVCPEVWADLLTNHSNCTDRFILIDRSKSKSTISMVYDYGEERCMIRLKKIKGQEVKCYIAKVSDRQKITGIVEHVQKLFQLYNLQCQPIVQEYLQLLKEKFHCHDRKIHNVLRVETRKLPLSEEEYFNRPLKLIAPEMFLPNYTRCCESLPRIVSPSKAEELRSQGIHVMEFPKPIENLPTYFFVVGDPDRKHKFIGLRINPLANKAQYPLLPACFQQDQRTKKKSWYRLYYSEMKTTFADLDIASARDGEVTRTLKGNRILLSGQKGKLPDLLEEMLESILLRSSSPLPAPPYFRMGTHRSFQSFLEAVMCALNWKNIQSLPPPEQALLVKEEFHRFIQSKAALYGCHQERSSFDNKHSDKHFAGVEDESQKYLNPRMALRAFELHFQCNIILVSNHDFIFPHFKHCYLRWQTHFKPCVLIYEHWGSERDHAKYPQCEWIPIPQPLSIQLHRIYLKAFGAIEIPSEVQEYLLKKLNAISQHLDSFGKVFALELQSPKTGERVTLFCKNHQLPPLLLPSTTKYHYVKIPKTFHMDGFFFETRCNAASTSSFEHRTSILHKYRQLRAQAAIDIEQLATPYLKEIARRRGRVILPPGMTLGRMQQPQCNDSNACMSKVENQILWVKPSTFRAFNRYQILQWKKARVHYFFSYMDGIVFKCALLSEENLKRFPIPDIFILLHEAKTYRIRSSALTGKTILLSIPIQKKMVLYQCTWLGEN